MAIPGASEEQEEAEEEERARERLALETRREYQERLTAVRPGDYQLQVSIALILQEHGKCVRGGRWEGVSSRLNTP